MDESGSTKIISQSFELEGIDFSWWSVGESPSLVTVSCRWFGRKSEFRPEGNEEAAKEIARAILRDHQKKADEVRAKLKEISDRRQVN